MGFLKPLLGNIALLFSLSAITHSDSVVESFVESADAYANSS